MRKRAGGGGAVVLAVVLGLAMLSLRAAPARAESPEPVDDVGEELPTPPLPRADWYTLETPHFEIHYYPDEWALAQKIAHFAERGYRLNTRYLNWRPTGRIQMMLSDFDDGANGRASSVPYTFIIAYGAPPEPLDELNDFDDYSKLLITHELTHVVHLDTMLSPCTLLFNTISGRTYAPNLAEPTWFVEGMAVLMETRQTTGGRLRSSFYDMHLRVPFLEHRMFGLDQVTNIPLAYPGGMAAYLYGSSMLRYIEDRYGPAKIREISHRYADTCIPGALNRTARDAVGMGYVGVFGTGIYQAWLRSMAHRFTLEVEDAARRPLTEATRITWEAPGPVGEGPGAKFFRDGTVVYHRASNDRSPAYVRLDPASGASSTLAEMVNTGAAVPTPDGRALILEQVTFLPVAWRIFGNPDVSWNDLYRYDLVTHDLRPLTRGVRAHEPDVSPDGQSIVCVLVGTGTRRLALVPGGGGEPRVLMPGAPGLAYTPSFSPDGRLIAYTRYKPGGFRDIHVYDLATATDRAIAVDRAMDMSPRFSPDGRFVVFSSDRTGIPNVFAYELATRRLYQVTNVLAGAYQPAVSPDGRRLVFTGFTTDGFDLWTMPFDPATFLLAQPFANARPDAPTDPDSEADSPDARPEDAAATPFPTRVLPYRPWKYLYPHAWTLSVLTDPLGTGDALQLQTSFSDPAQIHFFGANLYFPTGGPPAWQLNYSNFRLWPSFSFTLAESDSMTNGLIVGDNNLTYHQRTENFTGSVGLPVMRRADSFADVGLTYEYSAYGMVGAVPVGDPTAPITIRPQSGPFADLRLSWAFNNAHRWPYSISNQTGRIVQLNLRLLDPALGGRFHGTAVSWSWQEYVTPPWSRLQFFAFLTQGGFGIGDQRDFFSLGGYAEQDVVRALLLSQQQFAFLRGYKPNVVKGDSYLTFSAEYRAPLLWIERGYDTSLLYFRRIWGALFFDAGDAFVGAYQNGNVKTDAGAEVHLEMQLFYFLYTQVQLGFARGFQTGGGNQVYFVSSVTF
jgi:Tol biopolymer transport system component